MEDSKIISIEKNTRTAKPVNNLISDKYEHGNLVLLKSIIDEQLKNITKVYKSINVDCAFNISWTKIDTKEGYIINKNTNKKINNPHLLSLDMTFLKDNTSVPVYQMVYETGVDITKTKNLIQEEAYRHFIGNCLSSLIGGILNEVIDINTKISEEKEEVLEEEKENNTL